MDDMKPTLPPGLDSALNDFYTAPQPAPDFADRLERQLLAQFSAPETNRLTGQPATRSTGEPKNWSAFMQTLRARPALVLLLAILALALLAGAAYAIGQLSGFIPGFGFTTGDPGSVYMLAEPVEITHEGITLRVLQATSDLQRFSVTIEQLGQVESTSDFIYPFAAVLLPDGQEIEFRESSGDQENNRQVNIFEFAPLPPETSEISLRYQIIEREQGILWQAELPLRLRPLRANEIIPPPAQGPWQPIASESQAGLRLVLENVAVASDKTVLQVALRFDQPGTSLLGDWNVTLAGADGAIYPLMLVMNDSENRVKTYETVPFKGGESLTLSLTAFPDPRNLPLSLDLSGDAPVFTFDPGPNPQAGQTWQLDETLSVGSFTFTVTSAQLTNPNTLTFTLQSDRSANGVMLYSEKASGSRGGMPTSENAFSAELAFTTLPMEPFEIRLMRVNYTAQGEWNITWQAPAAPSGVLVGGTSTPAPTQSAYTGLTPAFSDPLWLELVRLTESFDAPFQQGPGWVHYVTETETTPRAGQTFPPPYIKSEQWLEIDEAGYITRTLHTDYDSAGNILQQSVTVGDYFVNFTVGDSGYLSGRRYRFSSSSLLQDFNAALEYNTIVTIEEILCEGGEPCYQITFLETFGTAVQNPGETRTLSGSARQVWVDKASGKTLQTRALWRFEDGTEQIEYTQTLLSLERLPAPPNKVTEILDKIVVP
jgi:hypothetical protein